MILADKIIALRKQSGWSQEQLAQELGVSRQSVSKWESGMSIPDIDKIMKLSNLFGVSTDYLLKDEIEAMTPSEAPHTDREEALTVDMDEAAAYLALVEQTAPIIAGAVSFLIFSVIPLLLLGAFSEYRGFMAEDAAGAIGVSVLLVCVVIGVVTLILNGMKLSKYEYLEKEVFTLQYGVQGVVEKKAEAFAPRHRTSIAIGVALCIIGAIPLILVGGLTGNEFIAACMTCPLMACIAIAVYFFIHSGMVQDSYDTLLQVGDYSPEEKIAGKKLDFFPGIYWTLTTAVYLYLSFRSGGWESTWIIWPVAGVLFAAIMGILKFAVTREK